MLYSGAEDGRDGAFARKIRAYIVCKIKDIYKLKLNAAKTSEGHCSFLYFSSLCL